MFYFMMGNNMKTQKIKFPSIINLFIMKFALIDFDQKAFFNNLSKIDILNLLKLDTKNYKYIINNFYFILSLLNMTVDIEEEYEYDENDYENNYNYYKNYSISLNSNISILIANMGLILRNMNIHTYKNIFAEKNYTNEDVINILKMDEDLENDFFDFFKYLVQKLNKDQLKNFVKNAWGTDSSLPPPSNNIKITLK